MSVIPYTGMGVWIKPIELVKDPRVSSKEGTISLGVVSAAVAVAVATFLSCLPFPPFLWMFYPSLSYTDRNIGDPLLVFSWSGSFPESGLKGI